MLFVAEFVTTGRGLTVTITLVAVPVHPCGSDVGVIRYSTLPAVVLLKFVSTWLIVAPAPAVAPDTLPVTEPTVHVNVLATLADNTRLVLSPLQMLIGTFVTAGLGLTVTIILYGVPGQLFVVEVGVTRYSTVPVAALLGFVKTWLMVLPDPSLAPVMLPVIAPTVHVKLLATLAVNDMFGLVPLHVTAVLAVVTTGVGVTVTVIVYGSPGQVPVVEVGVTIYSTVPGVVLLGLISMSLIVPVTPGFAPAIRPVIVPTAQVKLLGALEVNTIFVFVLLQMLFVDAFVTTGFGYTVTVIV